MQSQIRKPQILNVEALNFKKYLEIYAAMPNETHREQNYGQLPTPKARKNSTAST